MVLPFGSVKTVDWRPAGEVLSGVELASLPEDALVAEAVVIAKCVDADGHVGWYTRHSRGLHPVEHLGALEAARQLMRTDIVDVYEPDEDE